MQEECIVPAEAVAEAAAEEEEVAVALLEAVREAVQEVAPWVWVADLEEEAAEVLQHRHEVDAREAVSEVQEDQHRRQDMEMDPHPRRQDAERRIEMAMVVAAVVVWEPF